MDLYCGAKQVNGEIYCCWYTDIISLIPGTYQATRDSVRKINRTQVQGFQIPRQGSILGAVERKGDRNGIEKQRPGVFHFFTTVVASIHCILLKK
ncbi:hypothetical protein FGF1_14030 [Flavobacteriaceae bacterium GF1]